MKNRDLQRMQSPPFGTSFKKSSLHSSVEMQAAFIFFVLCDVSDGVTIPFCWRFHRFFCVKAATKVPQGYIRH